MAKKYIEDTMIEYLPDIPANRKMLKEVAAYDAMWKDLLKTHEGKFVAITDRLSIVMMTTKHC